MTADQQNEKNENEFFNIIPVNQVSERFDRIENKIDKLSEAMINVVRIEEKLIAVENRQRTIIDRISTDEHRVEVLRDMAIENKRIIDQITKISWLTFATLLAVIGNQIFGIIGG